VQQFKIARFIMHILETINLQIRFYEDTRQKKVVSTLTTESREETHKLSFGATQYMGLIII
jgi:hypothetical protein